MGNSYHYVGAMAYADDIRLLYPSLNSFNSMQQSVDIFVECANEYNIKLNCIKSHMHLFKGPQC